MNRHACFPTHRVFRRAVQAAVCGLSLAVCTGVAVPPVARAKIPSVEKIAIVDLQKVLQGTRQGKAARRKMERSAAAKQKKLDKMQKDLEGKVKAAAKLSGPERAKAEQRLQQSYVEMQQMAFSLQQDLSAQESKLLSEMYRKIQAIVAKIARKRGIDLVLVRDPGTVVFAKDAYDITRDIIEAYDAAHPK